MKASDTFNMLRPTLLGCMKNANWERGLSASVGRKCALGNELDTTCQVSSYKVP